MVRFGRAPGLLLFFVLTGAQLDKQDNMETVVIIFVSFLLTGKVLCDLAWKKVVSFSQLNRLPAD